MSTEREDICLRHAIAAAGSKGLSIDAANQTLKDTGISAKGHAKQAFGKIVFANNGGKGSNSYAAFDNRIMTREALIRHILATELSTDVLLEILDERS